MTMGTKALAEAPTGVQHVIRHRDAEAHVAQMGATLRSYVVGDVEVLDGFPVTGRATDGRGQVLAPWPNRIRGGEYFYDGQDVRAPLNEPDRRNAIHGLVRWLDWSVVEESESEVTLTCALRPQPGYEWPLHLEVTYALGAAGLAVTLSAKNTGTVRAPFGAGFHPYLRLGGGPIDGLELMLPAKRRLLLEGDASQTEPVTGTQWDFRRPRLLGDMKLDTAFGELDRDADHRAVAVLADPSHGSSLRLWVDEAFRYLMVYTGDDVHEENRRREAVAIEPMTCPPNAFRTGVDVVDLEPGSSWSGRWGVAPDLRHSREGQT